MTITFHVYGKPAGKGSARAFLPKGTTRPIITNANPNTKEWQKEISTVAREAKDREGWPLQETEGIAIEIVFSLSRPKRIKNTMPAHTTKPDQDKLERTVLDALTGILFRDDAQVCASNTRKFYHQPGGEPGVTITVSSPSHYVAPKIDTGQENLYDITSDHHDEEGACVSPHRP